jgi:hypothetical protein
VQKYKKLRTAYHKQALLHLAGQTSLRWHPVRHRVKLCCIPARLFLFYIHSAWPCFMSAASCRALPNINGDCMYSCPMSSKTSCLLRPGIVVLTCRVTKLDLFAVTKHLAWFVQR